MYVIIDLETTGHMAGNRITEIALFIHDGEKVLEEYQTLVNPECSIPPFIERLTGINDEMVKNAPKFYEVAETVQRLTETCIFIAHNVGFDYGTLRKEYAELGFDYKRKRLCTVRLARKAFPGHPKYSLGNICQALGIQITSRHRAYGDALATVELFERILEVDDGKIIPDALHHKSKEGTLPPALDLKEVEALPQATGIYYFKDDQGKVIYVGKAIDIRARVLSHFYTKEGKDKAMHAVVAHLDHLETGSELMALLIESAEIKRIYPLFNASQKRKRDPWAIFSYTDIQGIKHLSYAASKQVKRPLMRFYNITQCRTFLESMQQTFELCPKYCQLQNVNKACFDYHLKKCRGVCNEKERITDYNLRVDEAITSMGSLQGSFIILLEGRKESEYGYAYIENGVYRGYGFAEGEVDMDAMAKGLISQEDNSDVQRILRSYFRQTEAPQVMHVEEALVAEGQAVLSLF
jgi:DNA polymerase III subunit epsilon